jgi:hypothetical protein
MRSSRRCNESAATIQLLISCRKSISTRPSLNSAMVEVESSDTPYPGRSFLFLAPPLRRL